MTEAKAFAKINLGLVVGSLRPDGKHEVITVLQRVDLHDVLSIEPSAQLVVAGFAEDTIVRDALESLARAAGTEPRWRVHIEKRIPVAAGLGGGSSDAATALVLGNASLSQPLALDDLHRIAARVGADVPFFLREGTQLATADGTELAPVGLPTDYHVVLVVPRDEAKESTADVYAAFDERDGATGFDGRVTTFRRALGSIAAPRDLAQLPSNDLASSAIAAELVTAGAFRADVSGAGPSVYGLFEDAHEAARAAAALSGTGRTLVTRPVDAGDPVGVAR
jgi:4-diphosphocytidyl-2-C-methyl-D-erythritol kinase